MDKERNLDCAPSIDEIQALIDGAWELTLALPEMPLQRKLRGHLEAAQACVKSIMDEADPDKKETGDCPS